MRMSILNARVMTQKSSDDFTDLHISDGRIVALGSPPDGFRAERTISAERSVIIPGLVDLSVRLREPGFEYKASLESELSAASAGGVTSLVCPPDTDPPLDEPGLVEMLKHRARTLGQSRLYPLGALTVGLSGEKITEMVELSEAGCIGFSQADIPIVDTQVLLSALQYASTFGYSVWLRPKEFHLSRNGVVHQGSVALQLGLAGIPAISETIALNEIFDLIRVSGCRIHLCCISSAAGVELIRSAKKEGLPITADVAIHHLHLTDADVGFFDTHYRVDPPFRSRADREALSTALMDGTLDAICSDHTPVDDDQKQLPFSEAEPGLTAVELLLPLTLKWAKESGMPLFSAIEKITKNPSSIVKSGESRGEIAVGGSADLCIFDPDTTWCVTRQALLSQGKHTPFLDLYVQGKVKYTLRDGIVIYEGV